MDDDLQHPVSELPILIGLIAVDENFHGQKIGSDLVRKADSEAFMLGFGTIQVVTEYCSHIPL